MIIRFENEETAGRALARAHSTLKWRAFINRVEDSIAVCPTNPQINAETLRAVRPMRPVCAFFDDKPVFEDNIIETWAICASFGENANWKVLKGNIYYVPLYMDIRTSRQWYALLPVGNEAVVRIKNVDDFSPTHKYPLSFNGTVKLIKGYIPRKEEENDTTASYFIHLLRP
jgi:hypothetical protein